MEEIHLMMHGAPPTIAPGLLRRSRLSTIACRTGLLLALVSLGFSFGCQPPVENAIIGADGQFIRVEAISEIVGNDNLTTAEKQSQLEALGITDEALIDLLIRESDSL
jgi:hypothetical protein